MNSLRFWIITASVTWFIAGLGTGLLVSGVWNEQAPDSNAMEHYTNRMITEFDLEPDRARLLQLLMNEYQGEIERVKEQHMAQQSSEMDSELRRLGERYHDLIRNRALSAAQGEKFDQLYSITY